MRAIVIDEWGGRDRMHLADVEPPPVAPDGILVRVRAAGVNPVDTKIRGGYMAEALPSHFPLILGWDVAGVVERAGPAVTAFKAGDEVYGYSRRHPARGADRAPGPRDRGGPGRGGPVRDGRRGRRRALRAPARRGPRRAR